MARVTVEDCLEKVENRFHLVQLATKRARQLALTGVESFVEWGNDKPTVVALREIAEGFINDAMYENDETQHAAAETATGVERLSATFQEEEFDIANTFAIQRLASEQAENPVEGEISPLEDIEHEQDEHPAQDHTGHDHAEQGQDEHDE